MSFGAKERRRGAIARVRLCAGCSESDFKEGSIAADGSLQTCVNFTGLFLYCASKAVEYLKVEWN